MVCGRTGLIASVLYGLAVSSLAAQPSRVTEFLSWLPAPTESVLVVTRPFVLMPDRDTDDTSDRASDFLTRLALDPLRNGNDSPLRYFWGQRVSLLIFFARHFQRHQALPGSRVIPLGPQSYEGCSLLQVKVRADLAAKALSSLATATEPRYGFLGPGVFAYCNDPALFRELAAQHARPLQRVWRTWAAAAALDAKSGIWGLREFRPGSSPTDLTHPWQEHAEVPDPAARGFAFQLSLKTDTLRAIWISSSAANYWSTFRRPPNPAGIAYRQRDASHWVLPSASTEAAFPALWTCVNLLGFAITL